MEWVISFALGLVIIGCASYPQRFRSYKQKARIIIAEPSQVDAHCRRKGCRTSDSGKPITGRIRCCWVKPKPWQKWGTIWVGRGDESCLVHENCHIDGRPREECDKVHAR